MLSSRPAFCPPLFPPWVSIPNMVILLGLYQRPPPSPYPFSSSCWLYSAGRWVREIDRKAGRERRQGDSEGNDGVKGQRREEGTHNERRRTHSSCVSITNRAVRTPSHWRIFHCTTREQIFTSDIFVGRFQYQQLIFGQTQHLVLTVDGPEIAPSFIG